MRSIAARARPKTNHQDSTRLGFLTSDVSRMLRTTFDQALKPHGLTRSQWWILPNLARAEHRAGVTQTDLAAMLEVGKACLGGLVDRLAASGLVERRPDPDDRRANRLFITPQGRETRRAIAAVGRGLSLMIVEGIAPEDLRKAEQALLRMKLNLQQMLVDPPDDTEAA